MWCCVTLSWQLRCSKLNAKLEGLHCRRQKKCLVRLATVIQFQSWMIHTVFFGLLIQFNIMFHSDMSDANRQQQQRQQKTSTHSGHSEQIYVHATNGWKKKRLWTKYTSILCLLCLMRAQENARIAITSVWWIKWTIVVFNVGFWMIFFADYSVCGRACTTHTHREIERVTRHIAQFLICICSSLHGTRCTAYYVFIFIPPFISIGLRMCANILLFLLFFCEQMIFCNCTQSDYC